MAVPGSTLSDDQIFTLVVLERTGGSLSLFSVSLIFVAYACFERLRTVPNTFILFASIANAGASAASVIAYDGMYQGQTSSLCQAQGFLFEMFIQSDPWWSLAMAINVFLVFFCGASPHSIKKWGWAYCLVCYGGPCMIAFICLGLKDPNKGSVYGNAGLWCWISNDWNPLRIYSYYMLIWICIIMSMIIYLGIGFYVWHIRNRLQNMQWSGTVERTARAPVSTNDKSDEWPLSPKGDGAFFGTVNITTEVRVTHSRNESPRQSNHSVARPEKAYLEPMAPVWRTPNGKHGTNHTTTVQVTAPARPSTRSTARMGGGKPRSAIGSVIHSLKKRFVVLDPIKRAYLRTAFLFAVSVLVTWIPSSINRIHGLIYNDSPYPYNVASATVLPLQGVWNAIIFFVTSWKTLRSCISDWRTPGRGVVELSDSKLRERREREGYARADREDRWPGRDAQQPSPDAGGDTDGDNLETASAEHCKEELDHAGGEASSGSDRDASWEYADTGRAGSEIELRSVSHSNVI